jgi:hypothetical protein
MRIGNPNHSLCKQIRTERLWRNEILPIPDFHSNHCRYLFLSDDTISPNHLTHETNHKLNQTLQMSLPSHIAQAQQRIHSGASDASSPFRFLSFPSHLPLSRF